MDLFIFRLNAFKFLTQNKFNLNNEGFADIETLFYFFAISVVLSCFVKMEENTYWLNKLTWKI